VVRFLQVEILSKKGNEMNNQQVKEQAIETAAKWYISDTLSSFASVGFNSAVGRSVALLWELGSENISRLFRNRISITIDKNTSTAWVDLEKGIVGVSQNFFSSKFFTNLFGELDSEQLKQVAITLINGCIVHEGLHVRFTAPQITNLKRFVEETGRGTHRMLLKDGYSLETQITALNIVEDLYIESMVPSKLQPWITATQNILFSESDIEARGKAFSEEPSLESYINLCIAFKNVGLRNHEAFDGLTGEQRGILERSASGRIVDAVSRLAWSRELLIAFEIPEGDKSQSEPEKGNDGEQASGETFGEASDETEELSEKEAEKITVEIKEGAKKELEETSGICTFVGGCGDEVYWKTPIEKDILEVLERPTSAEIGDSIDFGFVKELIAKRTINRVPGQARKSGSVMVKSRLSRIATDQKVFAKRDAERQTLKRVEVIINVDFSSSTFGKVLNEEISAAYEMSKALRKARIPHSVYGHTSTDGETPIIYHIFSYDMKRTNVDLEARFERARCVYLSQNFDGVVVEYLSKKFTGKDANRYMFNLSDGCPAAPSYIGSAANQHTKEQIELARRKGIVVISLSVVRGVIEDNNSIYGSKWNLDASGDVSAAFKRMMLGFA
jgi:hypothetical protein